LRKKNPVSVFKALFRSIWINWLLLWSKQSASATYHETN